MIIKNDFWFDSEPILREKAEGLETEDFRYFDKDGFELCVAEQKFYKANNIHLDNSLNHPCCQQEWLNIKSDDIFVDHALILHRFAYDGEASEQLKSIEKYAPQANWLLNAPMKWGFDLAVDSISSGRHMFEVVHIEYDSFFHHDFNDKLYYTFDQIERMDWTKAAQQVWHHRDEWMYLKGFHQNHWKSKYLFGWNKAEYTEKMI